MHELTLFNSLWSLLKGLTKCIKGMSKKSFLSDLLFIFYGIYKNSFSLGLLSAGSLPKSAWFSLRFTWVQLTVFTLLENLVDHWLESIWKVRNPYNLTRKKILSLKFRKNSPKLSSMSVCWATRGSKKEMNFESLMLVQNEYRIQKNLPKLVAFRDLFILALIMGRILYITCIKSSAFFPVIPVEMK